MDVARAPIGATSPLLARLDELGDVDRIAIEDERAATSFKDLRRGALAAAGAMRAARGDLAGARVIVFGAHRAGTIASLFGALYAGAVAVPLSPQYPSGELAWFADDAAASMVVTTRDLRDRAEAFAGGRPVLDAEEIVRGDARETTDRALAQSPAIVLYTSGTTGKPKGAMLSHANVAVQASILREAWALSDRDVLLHALPLHHLHGLGISLMSALLAGATARMLPRFDARRVWEELAHATLWMAVPTMYQKMFEAFDAADAETRARWSANAKALRLATSGSAALPVTLAERWRELTGAIPLERFGMTEIGVGLTNPLEPAGRRAGSVGAPPPSVEIRIVDESKRDADVGELWVRGPSVFLGYLGRDDATRTAFEEGGWFKTGDVAERASDGRVRLLGRTSVDILKSGGYKLSALEIEEALREHDAIAEVAVVGIPDATWGDRVVAAIVPRTSREAECEEAKVRAWAKQRMAAYKVPRSVVVLEALPRNAIGKVLKPELTRMLAARG